MTETLLTTPDPLLSEFPVPLEQTFHPLGFDVRVSTNSPEILQAGNETWGQCERLFDEEPLRLRLSVNLQSTAPRPPSAMPRGHENLFSNIHSAENFSVADLARGFAYGWFTPSMTSDRAYFRYYFLESLAYAMLTARYLTPIHAACVTLRGAGVLLWGPSGAGKTSLAYACAKAGWEFVSDDGSYLVRKNTGQRWIVGRPHHIRFREAGRSLFPELANWEPCWRANGKLDIEPPSAELGIQKLAQRARVACIVILNRHAGSTVQLRPYPRENALTLMEQTICVGDQEVRHSQRESLRSLMELPVLELTYSALDDAERRLRSLIEDRVSA
jgi:hypothetical protein